MPREFRHALDDMLEALDGILTAVAGKTFDDYKSDWVLKHAVQRGIEIVSEASRALPRSRSGVAAGDSVATGAGNRQCAAP